MTASLTRQIDQLRTENDVLREQIEQLRAALRGSFTPPVAWGLTAQESLLLSVLVTRRLATRQAIMAALFGARVDDPPDGKIVDVILWKLRRKLPAEIEVRTRFGQGWYLDEDVRARLQSMEAC